MATHRFKGKMITGRCVSTAECLPDGKWPEAKGILKPNVDKKITVMSPTKFNRRKR
jgi:hypothetical protein